MRDSLPIDMLLSALSFLVVAQSSSEVPEGITLYLLRARTSRVSGDDARLQLT